MTVRRSLNRRRGDLFFFLLSGIGQRASSPNRRDFRHRFVRIARAAAAAAAVPITFGISRAVWRCRARGGGGVGGDGQPEISPSSPPPPPERSQVDRARTRTSHTTPQRRRRRGKRFSTLFSGIFIIKTPPIWFSRTSTRRVRRFPSRTVRNVVGGFSRAKTVSL